MRHCGKVVPNVERHLRLVHPAKKQRIVPLVTTDLKAMEARAEAREKARRDLGLTVA